MSMTQIKKTFSSNTDIPSESKQVQEKTTPFFNKFDYDFCERNAIQEIGKKYYISLHWSSVCVSVFCQKYNETIP
mgnify:CR=1 FL=1|tara:strand:+ start:142 stop:366 length:225 start_codon:yes stop_codon:yes gene_type:complete